MLTNINYRLNSIFEIRNFACSGEIKDAFEYVEYDMYNATDIVSTIMADSNTIKLYIYINDTSLFLIILGVIALVLPMLQYHDYNIEGFENSNGHCN